MLTAHIRAVELMLHPSISAPMIAVRYSLPSFLIRSPLLQMYCYWHYNASGILRFVLAFSLLWQYTSSMPAQQTKRRFDVPLQVRVTREQQRLFAKAAQKDGRPLSNWVRDRLEKAAKKELK